MDQNMATNLTLTLLVGWKVNCNNAEAVYKLSLYLIIVFQVNPWTVLERNNTM